MKIEIVCVVSPYGKSFSEFLRKTGEIFKSGQHQLEWRCIIDRNCDVPDGFTCIHRHKPTKSNAMNHASSLNVGANLFDADCIAFIDADIALLHRDWDAIMVDKLETHDSFGVSHKHDFYRYHNYPVCQFMAFSKRAMEGMSWDFSPKKGRRGGLVRYAATEEDAEICNVPAGTLLKKDTGWRVPYNLHKMGYTKSFVMDLVSIISGKTLMPYSSKEQKKFCYGIGGKNVVSGTSRMAEYHYGGEVYCTHFSRSRKVIAQNVEQNIWIERIAKYVKQRHKVEL